MTENMSLADQAVQAIALVKAMDADMTNDKPQRRVVRNLKRLAEQAIANGLRQAIDLAWQARDTETLVAEVRIEENKRALADLRD